MVELELHAHLKIRPGQLEGFKEQAAESRRRAAGSSRSSPTITS